MSLAVLLDFRKENNAIDLCAYHYSKIYCPIKRTVIKAYKLFHIKTPREDTPIQVGKTLKVPTSHSMPIAEAISRVEGVTCRSLYTSPMYSLIRCISSGSLCLMSIPRFLGSDLSEALRFRLQAYNSKHMFVVQEGPDQFLTRSVMLTLITVNIKRP